MHQPRSTRRFFSLLLSDTCRVVLVLLALAIPALSIPEKSRSNVVCQEQLSIEHRLGLANNLRRITGWSKLGFSSDGALQVGGAAALGGSQTARDLITQVIKGPNIIVLEDASNRTDVVFCRVVQAQWKDSELDHPPAYVVLIDFADFEKVMGDRRAMDAFNVGWGLLHEFEHVASNSSDAEEADETGECEAHINQMRRECDLPERADYFFTLFPLNASSDFKTRFVRLSFVEAISVKKQKRYWLIWDADLVGGIDKKEQIASVLR